MKTVCDEWVRDQEKKKIVTVIYAVGTLAAFETKEKAFEWKSFLSPQNDHKVYRITTTQEEVKE
jgi:tellurite resistance protein